MTKSRHTHPDIAWYRERLQPLVSKYLPDREGEWNPQADELERLFNRTREGLPVCFLGASGVGKSTLINALVTGKEVVLPTTGVGPLTAQAIVVRYGQEPSFEVEYHPAQQLSRILFPLEQDWKLQGEGGAAGAGTDEVGLTRLDVLRKQARQLITGKPDDPAAMPYVLDGLREALDRTRVWGTSCQSSDAERIRRIRDALAMVREGQKYRQDGSVGLDQFRANLRDHASGFLAPLIRRIELRWDSPLLAEGLTLVDLPGVGAAGDSFKLVTREYIPQARGVILTVNRSGIDEASADLLRTSGYLNRLLHAGDRLQEDPVQLIVVATQIDNVAEERYSADDSREKDDYFRAVRQEMIGRLRDQLRDQLRVIWQMGGAGFTEHEERVIADLVAGMQVHAVSAIQHRRFHAKRRGDPAFVQDPSDSGIPTLQENLVALARHLREQRRRDARRRLDSFLERVTARLGEFRPAPREQQRQALAQQARRDFLAYVREQQREFDNRQGQLRALWKDGVNQMIRAEVERGSRIAERRIQGYLGKLANANVSVKTLQAVVRYGGRFAGSTREIDLPHDLSLGFDGVMAEVWNDPILRDLRGRTGEFASDCADLVEEILAWAKDRELTDLLPPLEAHLRTIRADAGLLQIVGEDTTSRLRKEVATRLIAEIEDPITRQCQEFATSGLNQGTGTKQRILVMFQELAREVIEAARAVAIRIMTQCVEGVRQSVDAVWKNRDPMAPVVQLGQKPAPSPKPTAEELQQQAAWKQIEEALAARPRAEPIHETEAIGASS